MPAGETPEHKKLKTLAVRWACAQGYRSVGTEISLPHCGYRADVAAYRWASELTCSGGRNQRQAILGSTAVFECKQARADLLKDSCQTEKARAELEKLQQRRATIERLLKVHYPAHGLGDSLFLEYENFDFPGLAHRGHARLLQKIRALQNAILQKAKFEKLVRYRCANLFYLVLPGHLLKSYEVPLGWGVLVEEAGALAVFQKPPWHHSSEGARLSILQRLASSGHKFKAESGNTPIANRQAAPTMDDENP